MKFPMCRLQFGISSLADIRLLLKAWDKQLISEAQPIAWSTLLDILIEHRLPGEEVSLNFTAPPEVMDRFLTKLREQGLKFTCQEIIPGFSTMCRVEQEHF